MQITLHPCHLPLEHVFTIARGSKAVQPSLLVELEHNGFTGYGEAPDDTFYHQSLETLTKTVGSMAPILADHEFETPQKLWDLVHAHLPGNYFASSCLDIAANDLHGRITNQPLHRMWGLQWKNAPASSYTIGIDELSVMVAKLKERPNWPIYKIKLGTSNDIAIVEELRRHTDAIFRVDANCGWTVEQTIANSRELKALGVEFIEQPMPPETSRDDLAQVYADSALPLIADENCLIESDVEKCHGVFHGINVKLCKCGGLTPALRMLRHARDLGMKTMLGCMVESSVGISAAAHLAPLLDYADLDGAVLIAEDPATGVVIRDGEIRLPDRSGSGAELVPDKLAQLLA